MVKSGMYMQKQVEFLCYSIFLKLWHVIVFQSDKIREKKKTYIVNIYRQLVIFIHDTSLIIHVLLR